MLLAIDVGNTNIVIGCMDGNGMRFTERLSTDEGKTSLEYAILFRVTLDLHHVAPSMIDGAIISSVVPVITPVIRTALRKITGIQGSIKIILRNAVNSIALTGCFKAVFIAKNFYDL